jgi:hypothetical protein
VAQGLDLQREDGQDEAVEIIIIIGAKFELNPVNLTKIY